MWIKIASKYQIQDGAKVRGKVEEEKLTDLLRDEHDTCLIKESDPDNLMNLYYYSGKPAIGTVNGFPYNYGSLKKTGDDLVNEGWFVWKDLDVLNKTEFQIDDSSYDLWFEKKQIKKTIGDFENDTFEEVHFDIFICHLKMLEEKWEVRIYEELKKGTFQRHLTLFIDKIDEKIIKILKNNSRAEKVL